MGWIKENTAERMKKTVGFRNVPIHEYREMDWGIVFSIVTSHLGDFQDFANEVIAKSKSR